MCCDWSSASSVFAKRPAPYHNHQFNTNSTRPCPFILRMNYYKEEYCDVFETQDYNGGISGVQKNSHWYREELSHAQTATLHTSERWTCKKASLTLMLGERCNLSGNVAHVGPCWVYLEAKCQERPSTLNPEQVCDSDRSQREREREREKELHATAVSALQPLCKTMVKLVFLNAARVMWRRLAQGAVASRHLFVTAEAHNTANTCMHVTNTHTHSPTHIRTRWGILHWLNNHTERLWLFP